MDNKNLLKGTMVYTFSNILTKMGSLIFLPIMTIIRYMFMLFLSQDEFGIDFINILFRIEDNNRTMDS